MTHASPGSSWGIDCRARSRAKITCLDNKLQQQLVIDWAVEITTGRMPVCYRAGVASPPVQDRVPWRLIVQRTVNICARRCKARIIWRDEAPGG
jgi:hypothetical protein